MGATAGPPQTWPVLRASGGDVEVTIVVAGAAAMGIVRRRVRGVRRLRLGRLCWWWLTAATTTADRSLAKHGETLEDGTDGEKNTRIW